MTGIPNHFQEDNFIERRSGGEKSYGVAYNPESLITGAEIAAGTADFPRQWPGTAAYEEAVAGRVRIDHIPLIAPRVRNVFEKDRLAELLQATKEDAARGLAANGVHGPAESQTGLPAQIRLEQRLAAFYGVNRLLEDVGGVPV